MFRLISNSFLRFVELFVRAPSPTRRLVLVFIDAFLICLSVSTTLWFTSPYQFFLELKSVNHWLYLIALLVGLTVYFLSGQYTGLTRHVGSQTFYLVAVRNSLVVFIVFLLGFTFNIFLLPFSTWLLLLLVLTISIASYRFVFVIYFPK